LRRRRLRQQTGAPLRAECDDQVAKFTDEVMLEMSQAASIAWSNALILV